eukprot:XP_025003633.1 uncharacterized protein MOG isoform X18 [Gallus gallus]
MVMPFLHPCLHPLPVLSATPGASNTPCPVFLFHLLHSLGPPLIHTRGGRGGDNASTLPSAHPSQSDCTTREDSQKLLPLSSSPAQMWFVSGCKQSSFALPWRTLLAYLVALNLLCPGSVSSSDSGSYMCTVQDDGGYVEAMVNLQVSDPFSHIVHPWKVALAVVLTLLFASFVIIVFLHRMQAAQTKNLKIKDAVLEELPVILVKKIEEFEKENSQLKKQVAELVEQIEEFEKENSQLKEHYMKMVLSAADLKKQVAELEEKVFLQEALSAAILEIKIENQPHFPKLLSNVNSKYKKHCFFMVALIPPAQSLPPSAFREDAIEDNSIKDRSICSL